MPMIENKLQQDRCDPTPHRCTHSLLNNSLETTQKSRDFIEQNPTKTLPNNYSLFPGQLDYASCLSFTVGVYSKRHRESPNLWDYHLNLEDDITNKKSSIPQVHPFSSNSPISVLVGESSNGIVIACRTLSKGILRCNADETQVYLKLYRKSTTKKKLKELSNHYKPIDNINEYEQPTERIIHLPIRIEPSSQQITKDSSSGLIIIRFTKKILPE